MRKRLLSAILALAVMTLIFAAPVQAQILEPYGEGQIGLTAVVLCESLTVRKGPGASSPAADKLPYGQRIIVSRQEDGWAEIFTSDACDADAAGWVDTGFIAIDPAWYVTDAATPVYAWGDTAAPKVALLEKDITLPILKEDGDWLVVSLRGAAGWILKSAAD